MHFERDGIPSGTETSTPEDVQCDRCGGGSGGGAGSQTRMLESVTL